MSDLFDLSGAGSPWSPAIDRGGLGLEMVRAFARAGADVIVASRKIEACERAADEVRAFGRRALALAVNASNWDAMDGLAEDAYAAFGRIDILVNNAGMSPAMASHEMSEAWFDKIVSLNFKGPFRLAAQVAHRMAEGDGPGSIINISSRGALTPRPTVVAYSGAKAALNAMTLSMAHEYGPKVRVNAISAGPFLTDISKSWSEEAAPERRQFAGPPRVAPKRS